MEYCFDRWFGVCFSELTIEVFTPYEEQQNPNAVLHIGNCMTLQMVNVHAAEKHTLEER